MSNSSWIFYNISPFNYNSINPRLRLDDDILNDSSLGVILYHSRKEALEELIKEMHELDSFAMLKELNDIKPLQWKDATISTYIQSILARIIMPTAILLLVPMFRCRIKYFIKLSYDKNPEWWI